MSEGPTGKSLERSTLALLPGEPAGRIPTRSAGAVFFEATLTMRPGEEIPSGPILGEPTPGARFYSLTRTDDPTSGTYKISCEIRALHLNPLTAALNTVLRSVTVHAALAEAVLEARALRLAEPSVTPDYLVEKLARQLLQYGLRPTFGPSWAPVAGADVSVGTRGREEELQAFLHSYPGWKLLSW
ncbi:MAG: hypothetical protein H0X71_05555 [Rubrobacter sp.]|nr:hypothetical protein [Rubrobacter sp.]